MPAAKRPVGRLCAVLCMAAIFAASRPALADPIQAPGVSNAPDQLNLLVDQAILVTRQRNLDFQVHTPWQILHGLLALRTNYTLKNGNEFVNALDHISSSARFKNERWFERTQAGARARPYNGTPYDFEGHVNQSLAILAMCDLPLTHQFTVADGSKVTMADMVRHAQWAVSSKEETTWTLWFLTHYVDQDAHWTNFEGQKWSMENLLRIQTAASPYNAPCGGCHSLFAMAYARNAYLQKHGKLQGSWLEADQKLQQYISAAQVMMNRDGSFATQFFKARGYSNDFNERIKSSGHMLEWLMVALPRKRLDENWIRLGVQTLANDLIRNATAPADCGPLYHALHALILYKQRINPNANPNLPEQLAQQPLVPNAGALTLSAPDGESRPLSAAQQREAAATAARAMNRPQVTASANPITITPGTPAGRTNAQTMPAQTQASTTPPAKAAEAKPDQELFKAPVTAANPQKLEAPQATASATGENNGLKAANPSTPPVLMTPPANTAPALKPVQVAEEPETVKKLSGESTESTEKAKQADANAPVDVSGIDPKELSPVEGGMPILKESIESKETKPEEKSATASETDSSEKLEKLEGPAPPEPNPTQDVKAEQKPNEKETTETDKKTVGEPKPLTPAPNPKEVESKVKQAEAAAKSVAKPTR